MAVQGGKAESKVDMGHYESQRRDPPGGDDPEIVPMDKKVRENDGREKQVRYSL